MIVISTHTPLAGRDKYHTNFDHFYAISTHTPLAGRDMDSLFSAFNLKIFLLTRPSRGVTRYVKYNF